MSDLEKRVQALESYLQADPAFLPYGQLEKRIDDLERDRNALSTAVAELQRVTSEFIRVQAQKVSELEKTLHTMLDTESILHSRLEACEGKVESLTRTLDMWQEIMGIEVVVSVTGDAEHV